LVYFLFNVWRGLSDWQPSEARAQDIVSAANGIDFCYSSI